MWKIQQILLPVLLASVLGVEGIGGPNVFNRPMDVKVVIIGAGVSGVAAGTKLLENGIDNFVILEAEYSGGRIRSFPFGNDYVDLGAQWVHGEKGNVVFDMAYANNLLIKDVRKPAYIDSLGNIVEEKKANELSSILDDINNSAMLERDYTKSVGDYFIEKYSEQLQSHSLEKSSLTQEFLDWYEKDINGDVGSDTWFQPCIEGYSEYEEVEGHQEWAWKSGGFSKVIDLLTKKIPDPKKELPLNEKIYPFSEVATIVWDNLEDEYKDRTVVKCKNGNTYFADYVIITVSLGVLKETARKMFKPPLPASKLDSIDGLEFGTVDKVFLQFPSKWWPVNYSEFSLLWSADEKCKTEILNSSTNNDMEDCWDHFVVQFNEVINQPNILVGWLSGRAAKYMETLHEYVVGQKLKQLLQKFVGTAFKVDVPSPTKVLRSQWNSNPYFRGSYSYRSMESESKGASASHLAEPVPNQSGKPVLLFAGEATHSTHYSTVHGAIESGWREAERILTHLKAQ